jgi:thioester reductase-like protein
MSGHVSRHRSRDWAGAVLLTGATGFLGMELLARMLERTDRRIYALVRAGSQHEAESRLHATLSSLVPEPSRHQDQVRAVAGDLLAPRMGLADRWAQLVANVDEIVHVAASVSFSTPLVEMRSVNVEGTRHVLEFAEACHSTGGLRRMTHVSTAYTAGKRRGLISEHELEAGQSFRNAYEQSKFEAERLVRTHMIRLPVTIVRPSIVVGDRDTGWTSSFNVIYTPLRTLAAGLYPVVPARRRALVDIVSVDYVADAILALTEAPSAAGGTFHLVAGAHAVTAGELARLASAQFDRPPPRFVWPGAYTRPLRRFLAARSTPASRRLLQRTDAYVPYFSLRLRFDDRQARRILDPVGVRPSSLAEYFDRLMSFAQAARWGRNPIGRAHARALSGLPPSQVLSPSLTGRAAAGRPAESPAE